MLLPVPGTGRPLPHRLVLLLLCGAMLFLTACSSTAPPSGSATPASSSPEAPTPRLPDAPAALRAALTTFPKGADIHTHLTGAVYSETYLDIARARGLCYQPDPFVLTPCPADGDSAASVSPYGDLANTDTTVRRSVERLFESQTRYDRAINALSLRNWNGLTRSGHDQFFGTFDRFSAVHPTDPIAVSQQAGGYMAELVTRAAHQNLTYVEVQTLLRGRETADRTTGLSIPSGPDRFGVLADSLDARGFSALADSVAADFVRMDRIAAQEMGCPASTPACRVVRRYQYHAIRVLPPAAVFGQLLTGFRVAEQTDEVVGINLVAPEDNRIALRDYDLHMEMLAYLKAQYPDVDLTLHAGELTLGLVPPEHLRDHVDKAVNVAGATRIGHAIDFYMEDDPETLLAQFRAEGILIEVNLTSNDVILGVAGADHPLPLWMEAGVPLALSTDDEGVSRIDLTHEFHRAVLTYGLTLDDLITLARNSLHYSFLQGASLWTDGRYQQKVVPCRNASPAAPKPSTACKTYLDANPKAAAEWDYERRLHVWLQGR